MAQESAVRIVTDRFGRRSATGIHHIDLGQNLAGAGHEGVGFSNQSAQAAINKCCHSGHCTMAKGPGYERLATAVTRGRNGWYACILTK